MTVRIHVLHILNSAHGGSAISTFELIRTLSARGIKSSLVCFNNASPDQLIEIGQLVEGRVLFIPLYWMNKRIRSALWKRPLMEALNWWRTRGGHRYQSIISGFIREQGINIVHTSTILNPEGAIASKANNIPHVWHVRELVGPDKHFQFYNYTSWSKFVSTSCKFLVANSRVTEQCLLRFFSRDKVRCIPNGIYVKDFIPVVHSIEKRKVVVGMVGSLTTRWKNHEFFVRVANQFKEQTEMDFRIYGAIPPDDDIYYVQIRDLIRKLEVKNLQLIPFKKPPEIMAEIDVMFHPTEFESFGRIFTEAMAAGIPVVAINEGGALEMIRHGVNGYLVGKNDIEAARDHLKLLINDPELRETLGINGRKIVENEYNIDRLATSIEKLYEETLAGNSSEDI